MINVLIVEDEMPAANRLAKMMIEIEPDCKIVANCDSIESAVQFLRTATPPDLIMLDIQLGDGISFDIFNQVDICCPVIFTTAYDIYALKAFELNSIDYLLKPVNKEKLKLSIQKFLKLRQHSVSQNWQLIANILDQNKKDYKQRFLITVGEHLHSINIVDIAFFYSVEKSSFLTTHQNKTYPLDLSLDKLESILSPSDFFRINRQCIVSFAAINKMIILSKSRVKLQINPQPESETLVSTARTQDFKKWLDR